MDLILHGSTGAMGKAVAELAAGSKHTIAAFVSPEYPENTGSQYQKLADYAGPADCIIDFSNHAAAKDLTDYAAKRGIPLVIATTGYTEEELELMKACAKKVPVFHSANMSLGVAAMADLTRQAAALFPDADIEIVEYTISQKRVLNFLGIRNMPVFGCNIGPNRGREDGFEADEEDAGILLIREDRSWFT